MSSFDAGALKGPPDTMWSGRLILWQPARKGGYRFNLDPILLSGFICERPGPLGHVLDLGAGCGIIGLMLLTAGRAQQVTSVERQPELAACVRRNIAANDVAASATLMEGDLRHLALPKADIVAFNPPYYQVGHGHASVNLGRDAGRREVFGTLDDFLAAAVAALKSHGSIMAIIPMARAQQFVLSATKFKLVIQRQRAVHAFADGPAKHCLIQAGWRHLDHDGGGTVVQEPCVVHERKGGEYTAEVAALIGGPWPRAAP